jgi:hypothetical protein
MLKIERGSVQGYKELDVPFQLLKKAEESKKLAIMLPGAGYTTSAPLFHYATEVFLNRSFDVLEVNYQYKNSAYDEFSTEELGEAIKQDVKTVLDQVLEDSAYEDFYVVGKSLGTIAMATEMKRSAFKLAKAIWLTPLLHRDDVYFAMAKSRHTGLCFIGDKDPIYIKEQYAQLENNPNIAYTLLSGANHSLEFEDDPLKSIDVLKDVISEIQNFK